VTYARTGSIGAALKQGAITYAVEVAVAQLGRGNADATGGDGSSLSDATGGGAPVNDATGGGAPVNDATGGGAPVNDATGGGAPVNHATESPGPDNSLKITVTAQGTAQKGPLLAMEAPFIDPFLEAIRTRPVSPSEFGKTPNYGTQTGVPEPLPPPEPQNFWYHFFNLFDEAKEYIDGIFSAPPIIASCTPGTCP
jgi:hypothetical protein